MVENSYHWRSTIHEFWDVLWPLKQISNQPPWWNTTISSHAADAAGGDPTQFSYDLTGTTGCPVVNPGRWWFRIKECRNAPNLQGLEAVILPRSFGVVQKQLGMMFAKFCGICCVNLEVAVEWTKMVRGCFMETTFVIDGLVQDVFGTSNWHHFFCPGL